MTVYLSATGISAARKISGTFNDNWINSHGGVDRAATRLMDSFRLYQFSDHVTARKHLPVEINSLAQMPVTSDDQVYLFSAETLMAQTCAKAIALYLEEQLPGIKCEVVNILGLQQKDELRLYTVGLVEYVKALLQIINSHRLEQYVLNLVPGYQFLLPYVLIICLLKQIKCQFILEGQGQPAQLPSVPVEFMLSSLLEIQELINNIANQGYISKARYQEFIDCKNLAHVEQTQSLFNVCDNQVRLSALGLVMYNEFNNSVILTPFLSHCMLAVFANKLQAVGTNLTSRLYSVCRKQQELEQCMQAEVGAGLFWLKLYEYTEYFLVSVEGRRLLIWKIVEGHEYTRLSAQHDLGERLLQERSKIAPFIRIDLIF